MNLSQLADRVEALEGPCRETDALIAAACRVGNEWAWAGNYPEWLGRADGRVYLEDGGPSFAAPKFTASLDSAMSLVSGKRVILNIAEDGITTAIADGTQGCAFNAASALTAAALRVRDVK